jgi:hypothetical protein
MNNPTPAKFCELQLRIASFVQQQLAAAAERGDSFNEVAALSRMLKDITSSYRDISGNGSSPSKLFSQGLGYGSITNLSPEPRRQEPKIPTQYSYPDGFEGVTLPNGDDAWDEQ